MDGMTSPRKSWAWPSKISLRVKIALGVTLPIIAILALLSYIHYIRERQLFEEQIQLTTIQMSEVVLGGLSHAMMTNNRVMLAAITDDLGEIQSVQDIKIIDTNGVVKASNHPEIVPLELSFNQQGCIECHQQPAESRPRVIKLDGGNDVLRISTPIENKPDCYGCHPQEIEHLGILLVDAPLSDLDRYLLFDLRMNLSYAMWSIVLAGLVAYFLIHRLVVRRIEAIGSRLQAYTAGNFEIRLPLSTGRSQDELTDLADAFNHMADERERYERDQEERTQIRQRAIIEERERVSRELHDGLAQLLGYIKNKVVAVRLLLHNQKLEDAERHLSHLEEASQGLFVDVREAILGLKMAGQVGNNLAKTIQECTTQFSRLSDLPVHLEISPAAENSHPNTEIELQILRILQESLSNARRHSHAEQVWVSLEYEDDLLGLSIRDDGIGFNPEVREGDSEYHFGLSNMRERAELIGARIDIVTQPGSGTTVKVRFPLQESP